ncbi:unnamed protein product [Urochloa humidicola]
MFNWKAYLKQKESIIKLFDTLRHALARYKDRRIRAGYFYMCKHQSLDLVFVMSPLYTMLRKEALKKIRYILQKREVYGPTRNKTTLGTRVSDMARRIARVPENIRGRILMQVWLLYLLVIAIACAIVLYN